MEWSTHQVVEATGVTSRILRHYDEIGLLNPAYTGVGGLRYYDQQALYRLQRILLLRQAGLSLSDIADVLNGQQDGLAALRSYRQRLLIEQQRIATQVRSVEASIAALENGGQLMPQDMFAGFDHTKYETEARERWGDAAIDRSNTWWSNMSVQDQGAFVQ